MNQFFLREPKTMIVIFLQNVKSSQKKSSDIINLYNLLVIFFLLNQAGVILPCLLRLNKNILC